MPVLWKTSISLAVRGDIDDSDLALKKFKYVSEILPKVASVTFYAYSSSKDNMSRFIPYLPLISDFSWTCPDHALHPELGSVAVPPNGFSRFKSLRVGFPVTQQPIGVFGHASHLVRLMVEWDTPAFLLSDIPWHQLRLLNLSFRNSHLTEETRSLWMDFARLDPFRAMDSLTTLFLDMRAEYLDILLPLSFPWHRLQFLTIYWQDNPNLLFKIVETLGNCTSLLKFDVNFREDVLNVSSFIAMAQRVQLPSLTHIAWTSAPFALIRAFFSPENLRSLKLGDIALQEFYTILEQCPRLSNFECFILYSNHEPPRNKILLSPCLASLEIVVDSDELFPTLLQAPLLASLSITFMGDFSPLIFDYIGRLNLTSDGRLERFTMQCSHFSMSPQPPLQIALTTELLSSLSTCFDIYVVLQVITVDHALPAFASRDLFPQLETLGIVSANPHGFFASFESRIEKEKASGMVKLRYLWILFLTSEPAIAAPLEAKFRKLEAHYGIRCQVAWIAVKE
ncbi:hypothetical protein H0H93_004358 [Arthromyces matolae]|nr:hypothetical protein H0H93_004358 [Arthromyces matolae]